MSDSQGYYSIIQYRPDPARAEGLNVGIVLTSPGLAVTRFRCLDDLDAVFERLRVDRRELLWVRGNLHALGARLEALAERSPDALRRFAACESEEFALLPVRSIAVDDVDKTLGRLFERLVRQPIEVPTQLWSTLTAPKPGGDANVLSPRPTVDSFELNLGPGRGPTANPFPLTSLPTH